MVSASNIYEEYSIKELAKSKMPNFVFAYRQDDIEWAINLCRLYNWIISQWYNSRN